MPTKYVLLKKIETLNLEPMGISSPIFTNDSLCAYYKMLWAKCQNLWFNKYIYGFGVSYGLIKTKVSESSLPVTITLDIDLENNLQETHCSKIIQRIEITLTNYTSQMLFFIQLPPLK